MKNVVKCPNPECYIKDEKTNEMRPTLITPNNALYKYSDQESRPYFFSAPKTFLNRWSKKILPPLSTNKKLSIDGRSGIYCPNCKKGPIDTRRIPIRIVACGPTNSGKTVYLTVLKDLLRNVPLCNLSLRLDDGLDYFEFQSQGADNEHYLVLDQNQELAEVSWGVTNPILWFLQEKGYIGTGSEFNNFDNLDIYIYDVPGEAFNAENEFEFNEKYSYVHDADLLLMMFDSRRFDACKHLVDGKTIGIDSNYDKNIYKGRITDNYLQIMRNILKSHEQYKEKKEFYVACCINSIDIVNEMLYYDQLNKDIESKNTNQEASKAFWEMVKSQIQLDSSAAFREMVKHQIQSDAFNFNAKNHNFISKNNGETFDIERYEEVEKSILNEIKAADPLAGQFIISTKNAYGDRCGLFLVSSIGYASFDKKNLNKGEKRLYFPNQTQKGNRPYLKFCAINSNKNF